MRGDVEPDPAPMLIRQLAAPAAGERAQAAWALGEIADPRAVDPLLGALRAGTMDDRQCAIAALGKLKEPRAILPLITALDQCIGPARQATLDALRAISGQNLGDDPATWQQWWAKQK